MKKIAALIPIKTMAKKSVDWTQYVNGRWDVPNDDWVPEDMRNLTPILPYTLDKIPTSGLYLDDDTAEANDYNPAVILASGLMPLAVLILSFVPFFAKSATSITQLIPALSIALISVLIAVFTTWMLAQNALRPGLIVKSLIFGLGLPVLGLLISAGGPSSAMAIKMQLMTIGYVVTAAAFVMFILSYFTPYAKKPRNILYYAIAAIAALAIVTATVPSLAFPLTILLSVYAPRSIFRSIRWDRAERLQATGTMFAGQTTGSNLEAHIKRRHEQAVNAAKDKTPSIRIGKAEGVLVERCDPQAYDAGSPVLMSYGRDMSTSLMVEGQVGSGKTEHLLIPATVQMMTDPECGGICVMDGKANFAEAFKANPNYTIVTPNQYDIITGEKLVDGMVINPIKNVPIGMVTEIIAMVIKGKSEEGNEDPFFKNQGLYLGYNAEMLVHWVRLTEEHMNVCGYSHPSQLGWKWCLNDILNAVLKMSDTKGIRDGEERELLGIVDMLNEYCPLPPSRNPVLKECIDYIVNVIPKVAASDKTWGGVVSSTLNYFQPFKKNRDLLEWAACSEGEFDVNSILRGAQMGIYMPSKYGQAGTAYQLLIHLQQLFEGRARPADWREKDPTATEFCFVIDEFPNLCTHWDIDALANLRSQGGRYIVATQSRASMIKAIGEEATPVLYTNILSNVVFRCDEITFEYHQKKAGTTIRASSGGQAMKLNMMQTLRKMANNPANDWTSAAGSKIMERLASQGFGTTAGGVSSSGTFESNIEGLKEHNRFLKFDIAGNYEERPLLTSADFHALTRGGGYAFVSVMRGGAVRRDFCHLPRMRIEDIKPEWFPKKKTIDLVK